MTTIQMQCFLEAARCLNFTTASEHLYISQPALSKQISKLETELDARLFLRQSNTVTLTPTGKALYHDLSDIYQDYENMLERVNRIKQGVSGQLDFAIQEDQLMNQEIILAIQWLIRNYPNTRINIRHANLNEIHSGLLNGQLDFGVIINHYEAHVAQFDHITIKAEQEFLAVPVTPLLAEKNIRIRADYEQEKIPLPLFLLDQENFEMPTRPFLGSLSHQRNVEQFKKGNVRYVSSMGAIPLLVVAGLGSTIVNETHMLRDDPHVVFLEDDHEYKIEKGIFWNRDNQNPLLPVFQQCLKDELT